MLGWNRGSGVRVPVDRADSVTPLTLASDRSLMAVLSSIVSAADWYGMEWCGDEKWCDVMMIGGAVWCSDEKWCSVVW